MNARRLARRAAEWTGKCMRCPLLTVQPIAKNFCQPPTSVNSQVDSFGATDLALGDSAPIA